MREAFRVDLLSDHFGQYTLILTCVACHHKREAEPRALANLFGWNTNLHDMAKRLRCSKCGQKRSTTRAVPPIKPRGYRDVRG